MPNKKINALDVRTAVATDLMLVGDPSTGIAYKSTLATLPLVPTSRTITINGVAFDLSANRAWTIGTVTSVGLTMPSAFNVGSSPITSSGTIAVTGAGTTLQYIDGTGALQTFPTIMQASDIIAEVRNQSGATMTKGTIVYISGATGNKPLISKALASSDATSAQTFGLVQADIANNATGYIVIIGNITDIDTSALTEGQQLYLSGTTAGTWTTTKPYAPIHLVYVGIVIRSHINFGIISVKIQNGYEMDELHNVSAQSPANNDGLFWNSSTNLWSKNTIGGVLGYTPQAALTLTTTGTSGAATLVGATLNIPQYSGGGGGSMAIGGAITSATAGSVLFAGTSGVLQQDNANLFWDDTNNRLGIGTAAPATRLDIQGTTASDGGQLGSELTTTGSGTNWAGTSFATGYTHTTGSVVALTTSLAAISGTIYQFVYTITGRTTGSITIGYGGISIASITSSGNFGRPATSSASLSITPTTDFNGTIVLSIKVVTAGSSLINTRNSAGTISSEIRSYPTSFYIGVDSGKFNTLGSYNIGIGYQSLVDNVVGQNNIGIGYQALQRTLASDNIAFGYRAGASITTGTYNILFGTNSAVVLTTGSSNILFGFQSGLSLSTGSENILIGLNAGQQLTTGTRNYFAGISAGGQITTGSSNIAIGSEALLKTGTASNNIGIGERAGAYTSAYSSVVPSNCIYIGASCFSGATAPSNEIVIGSTTFTIGLGSNTTMIGNSNTITTALRGRLILGTTTDSGLYQADINGSTRVNQLYLRALNTAPATSTSTGTLGEIRIDAGAIYVCTATNTWVRALLTTF